MTKTGIIIKIQLLQGSNAKDYFESKERLFLNTILSKLQKTFDADQDLTDNEKNMLECIFTKYKKFL